MRSAALRLATLRETFSISFPLMLASLSIYLMYMIDRVILACYSIQALNAVVPVISLTWAFWGGVSVMAGMSEILIAQSRNQNPQLIGKTIWHAIWLSLIAAAVLIPTACILERTFYCHDAVQGDCFFWSMLFGVLDPLSFALTTFFIGQGKTKFILLLTLAKTLWHAFFDYALIFGIAPWLPSLGAKGAPIASGLTMCIQAAILFRYFLKKTNRFQFGTGDCRPRFNLLLHIVKLTGPLALLYNIELWGWGLFYMIIATSSHVHITVSSLCESLICFFMFIADGLYRGSLLQASHSIAQGKENHLYRIFISVSMILGICLLIQLLVLWVSPSIYLSALTPLTEDLRSLLPAFETCIRFAFFYLFFQGMQWLLSAFLCAIGETLPMMFTGTVGLFAFLVLPTYFFIYKRGYSVEWAWGIVLFYSILCCAFYSSIFLKRLRKKGTKPRWSPIALEELALSLVHEKSS